MKDNELIAIFMNAEVISESPISKEKSYKIIHDYGSLSSPYWGSYRGSQMRFSNSWDWLMPVVQKIDALMPKINMPDDLDSLKNGIHGSEPYIDILCMPISSKIDEVYGAVVKFIEWYNQQPK